MILAGLPLAGCAGLKYESGSWGGGGDHHFAETSSGRKIIDFEITHLTLNSQVYCVLVSEGGGGSIHGGPPASGSLRGPDGREVEWLCDTPDGRSGRVTIGGRQFKLENGAVFLINLRDETTPVEQVVVDTGVFECSSVSVDDGLKAAAQSNERLAAFLKECETAE
jgi:hypothetical protein